jgi:catechol 2,3-dioxygenase-like lactoylglutathione lyase family enzyme
LTPLVDVRTPLPREVPAGLVAGYSGVVVEVADAARARTFYRDVLGMRGDGDTKEGPRLRHGDASVVVAERRQPRTLPETGAHVAYRMARSSLDGATARLAAAGVAVHGYREDRSAEEKENRYLSDPDGNRIQLVEGAPGIDHVGLETHDMEWAEIYWTHVIGGRVEGRVGWHMDDFERAFRWGEGKDERAPGTRRWDRRYTTIEGQARLPRPNTQLFVTLADAVTVTIFLANEHRQEPPRDLWRGTPRTIFATDASALREIERRFREVHLRCLHATEFGGPFIREGERLYAKDVGGNFLEFGERTP